MREAREKSALVQSLNSATTIEWPVRSSGHQAVRDRASTQSLGCRSMAWRRTITSIGRRALRAHMAHRRPTTNGGESTANGSEYGWKERKFEAISDLTIAC